MWTGMQEMCMKQRKATLGMNYGVELNVEMVFVRKWW